jgi:phosphate-selective porin OprO/OprP
MKVRIDPAGRSGFDRERQFLWIAVALLVAAILFPAPGHAREVLVVSGVVLIDAEAVDGAQDARVNIQIVDGKLDLISADPIPADDAMVSYEADGGVVLGVLNLREPASFIVLEADPRADFAVLLDTASYISFAIQDGEVVRNRLRRRYREAVPAAETGPVRRAPTRAPVALPINYGRKHRWNAWDRKWTRGAFLAAGVIDRQNWVSQDTANNSQVGDLSDSSSGEVRGIRFGAVGTINFKKPWVYTLFGATNAYDRGFDPKEVDGVTWFDYRLDMPFTHWATLSVGKQKEPIAFERTMTLINQPMMERSASGDAMLPSRNFGLVFTGFSKNQRMTWGLGAFNRWFENEIAFGDSPTVVVARLTGLAYQSPSEDSLLHLGVGSRYSDAKLGIRYVTTPEINNSPVFVDTGEFPADDAWTWNVESSFRSGRLWLIGEFTQSRVFAPSAGDPVFNGYYVAGAWALTGEVREYDGRYGILRSMPVARPVDRGGFGALEVTARWSTLDLTDGAIEGGDLQVASAGLNWWLTASASLSMNYRHVILDRMGEIGHADSELSFDPRNPTRFRWSDGSRPSRDACCLLSPAGCSDDPRRT